MNICYTLGESCWPDSPDTTRILSEKRSDLSSPATFFMSCLTGTLPVTVLRIYCVYVCCDYRGGRGTMKDHQMHDLPRVHVRALARLQQIHEAISTGHCPSVQDLAAHTDRNPRTIKRDVKALREDFKAPLMYDRQHKGFRYAEPGWQLPPVRFS